MVSLRIATVDLVFSEVVMGGFCLMLQESKQKDNEQWSPVLWAEIGESSLTGPKLVLDTTNKVVLTKEKLKAERDRQKSYADNRRKPLC
ncbi:hypothetical protein Tco_1339120 [Tanacetum coccineum]